MAGLFSGLILLREPFNRRIELCLYALPKLLDSIWNIASRQGVIPSFRFGEILTFALAFGVIGSSLKTGSPLGSLPSYVAIIRNLLWY